MSLFHIMVAPEGDAPWLEACVQSALSQAYTPWRVTLCPGEGARKAAYNVASGHERIHVMTSPHGTTLAERLNRAAMSAREPDLLLMLEPDAVLAHDALDRLVEAFESHPGVGLIGCKVLGEDVETLHQAGIELRGNGLPRYLGQGERDEGQFDDIIDATSVQEGAIAVRRDVWCELGGLDAQFPPGCYEQADFCLRARACQWRIATAGRATVTRFEVDARAGSPERLEQFYRSRARFLLKHYSTRQWLRYFLPDEVRWWRQRDSRGHRWPALRTLVGTLMHRNGHDNDDA